MSSKLGLQAACQDQCRVAGYIGRNQLTVVVRRRSAGATGTSGSLIIDKCSFTARTMTFSERIAAEETDVPVSQQHARTDRRSLAVWVSTSSTAASNALRAGLRLVTVFGAGRAPHAKMTGGVAAGQLERISGSISMLFRARQRHTWIKPGLFRGRTRIFRSHMNFVRLGWLDLPMIG